MNKWKRIEGGYYVREDGAEIMYCANAGYHWRLKRNDLPMPQPINVWMSFHPTLAEAKAAASK